MPAAESAIQFWIVCLSASRDPNASRESEYEHISSNARAARIYDGPDEVHRMVVSRRILKTFENGGVWRFE